MALCDSSLEQSIRAKYFDKLNALAPLPRFLEKFRLSLEALTPELRPTDRIFGWFSFTPPTPLPEYRTFKDELPPPELQKIMEAPAALASHTNIDRGHLLADYDFLLQKGLVAYEKEIGKALCHSPDNEYLAAMASSISIVHSFSARLADEAERQLQNAAAGDIPRLTAIRDAVRRVPYLPAENFTEAIQSIWIIHFLLPLAGNSWYSISLGRLDRYLYPYYKKALEEGMPQEEIKAILRQFYELLNAYADGACAMNVGGEEYNELSFLLIACQKEFALPAPILCARVTESTPPAVWEKLIDGELFSRGQPTFYGEESCRRALEEKGLSPEEASGFSNNSCMGISIAGAEFNSMWGCVAVIPAALELACNRGRLLKDDSTVFVPGIGDIPDFETLRRAFEKAAAYLIDLCVTSYKAKATWFEVHTPAPFVSLLTADCIAKGCDCVRGARYHNVTVECMGMINAADGLCAIDQLVFREKKITLDRLNRAVRDDFQGYETLQKELCAVKKFGENGEADRYAVGVADFLQKTIRRYNHDNVYYAPSLHTLDVNVGYGSAWGAGYDGRKAGTPFAKNAGPSNQARSAVPTSAVLSSSSLPQACFYGGQPLDINFQADMVKHHKDSIARLIRVYMERGGLQFQVNSLSSSLLREAVAHPENYPHLIVRIGGYSILFNRISQKSKEEFIERFEKEGY